MRSTFKILFYLNTSKKKQSGLCPVLGRITVDGGIAQFSIKEYAHPDSWDVKKGRLKGNSRENSELNRKLDQTEQDIRNIYQQTVDTNGFVTAEQIKNEITGVTAKSKNLLELFREHNLEYEKRVDVDRRKGSYAAYKYAYKHLSGYIRSKYEQEGNPDLSRGEVAWWKKNRQSRESMIYCCPCVPHITRYSPHIGMLTHMIGILKIFITT